MLKSLCTKKEKRHSDIRPKRSADTARCTFDAAIFWKHFKSCCSINFLFFNDNSIHQIYEDGGSYNILYFLPQISISFALSNIIIIIIKYIFLSESNIKEIKIQKTFEEANNIFDKIKNRLI